MKIYIHPDNLELIKKQLDKKVVTNLYGIEIIVDRHLDKEKWSGKYVLPDGKIVEAKDLKISWGKFAEFGPEDVNYLLFLGIIKKHMELFFYKVDDTMFHFPEMPFLTLPHYFVTNMI